MSGGQHFWQAKGRGSLSLTHTGASVDSEDKNLAKQNKTLAGLTVPNDSATPMMLDSKIITNACSS